MTYQITPLPQRYLEQLRRTGLDDLQQPVEPLIAQGGEPLRDVLRRARAGERILLASYSPFERVGAFREYGPVYVLAEDAAEAPHAPLGEAASDYFASSLTLRGYSKREHILDAKLLALGDAPQTIAALFADPEIAFVHARFAAYGCFACRIDRARA